VAFGFRRTLTGRVTGRLDVVERGLLRTLIEQLVGMIEPPESPGADPLAVELGLEDLDSGVEHIGLLDDRDPVLDRLFPPGYEDAAEALEFRRFTELGLRQQKVAAALSVLATLDDGDKITLDEAQSMAWLTTLNDLRLALSVRLGIEGEADHQRLQALPEDDEQFVQYQLYDFLTYLQETLVRAVSR
jgi:hypothetical protein